jgi:hypothetical protein
MPVISWARNRTIVFYCRAAEDLPGEVWIA